MATTKMTMTTSDGYKKQRAENAPMDINLVDGNHKPSSPAAIKAALIDSVFKYWLSLI
ncbi:hypothetical protein [Limnohabitans sp. 2KL-1]|uniref:hypothetical protein n=1 Tax=Limnohabitans sp. 2KL-1 TaxID=1100699 RepID=UPI001E32322C|nr:hypothetical protein [Limnohabitans sp. 2KL-1]